MCGPGLQGHPSGVRTLRAEQLADVGRHHDVNAAVGAHVLPTHTETRRSGTIIASGPAAPHNPIHLLPVDGSQLSEGPLHVHVKMAETILPPELEQVDPATPPRVRDLLEGPHLPLWLPDRHHCRRRGAQRPASKHLPANTGVGLDVHVLHRVAVSARVVARVAYPPAALLLTSLNVSR